ncbi:hypothetical protein [Moorena sp. SIO4G3]|uniref:hypothetical protein n=1 Tax=Moorena sp. SIO4G3 TaxID=2607821 RepID=UPI0014292A10|nr:hypothetical protein [Moorena sp. SIO4G3]NEO76300.1 hypothetical protein [Moorena sp. SIO4G3]
MFRKFFALLTVFVVGFCTFSPPSYAYSNKVAVFTTNRDQQTKNYGSSLYLVKKDWVLRCSGNTNGRDAETFARKRAITYTKPGATFDFPALGLTPVEGGHTGNPITAVLNDTGKIPQDPPPNWNAKNGVSWETAAIEVLAAEAATTTEVAQSGRFSRKVGELVFKPD